MVNIFISGASTGIGRATAARLAAKGHTVFAGVRKEADASSLREEIGSGVVPVFLDVTDREQVNAAAAFVAGQVGSEGLYGLVNNAGIASGGPIEHTGPDHFRRVMEVNVISHVAMTQAFTPLVRQARGRILFTGSIAGIVGLPMLGAYSASKSALHGFTESLRGELSPWGIKVVLIEPGPVATPIVNEKGDAELAQWKASATPEARQQYAAQVVAGENILDYLKAKAVPVERAAKVMERALFTRNPRHRYLVGGEASQTALGARVLPARAFAIVAGIKTGSRIKAR